ncbi:MAG: ABC transporter permease [Armatimonadetes bacterium]|nr:ABC transporter permease [Armatimonadota bacterium]
MTMHAPTGGVLKWIMPPLIFIGEVSILFFEAGRRIFKRPFEAAETMNQMAFVGVASVPIIALTTFASGAVLSLYLTPLLLDSGAAPLLGAMIALTITREIAPVIAGIMVAARCGSAMAAQISSMAVTEQLDALRALSVHPYSYLVVPRMLAGALMLPILCLVGIFTGVGGGLIVASVYGIPPDVFMHSVETWIEPWDFAGGLLKTVAFGLIVTLVSCQQGLRAKGGAVGVGRATTNAVVISIVLVYIANFFLADLFY